MTRDDVLAILRSERPRLRSEFGVRSLALFGSVARGEATDKSDVDLLVEFDRPISYFDLFHVEDELRRCLGGAEVDLVLRDAVIDELKATIYGEAIDVGP
jgi:predicted nucleotidyltransferase